MGESTDLKSFKGEIWLDVKGYNGNYQISNFGRVKSLFKNKPQILKKTISGGKHKVQLYLKPGRFKNELVDRLVCSAFNRNPEENEIIVHSDGNNLNDKSKNLFWISKKESVRNAKNKKRYANACDSNGMAKLSPEKVVKVREYKDAGKSNLWIANTFGVSAPTIQRIVSGRTWKSVSK